MAAQKLDKLYDSIMLALAQGKRAAKTDERARVRGVSAAQLASFRASADKVKSSGRLLGKGRVAQREALKSIKGARRAFSREMNAIKKSWSF